MIALNANVSESRGLEHSTFVHLKSHRESKVVYCRQWIALVKQIGREASSEVELMIALACN